MTTVYGVSHAEGTFYVATRVQAVRDARELKRAGDLFVGIVQYKVADLPVRALYCRLLNGEGWAARQTEIEL